jgi:SNF2 family DNA or RNA helicase
VTTYDSLKSLSSPPGVALGMLVIDEAHYAKNMSAERTKAVRQWASTTNRVLFLTGTPMENRVEEFQVLVSHLRPDLMLRVNNMDGLIGAGHFRTSVAPVYLRRNQSDVLAELPPRVDIEDWVELKPRDLDAYRQAVAAGNFMAMRRAAYAPARPTDSAKLGRLAEIVEEAAANGRKVVVFSYFREVLDTIATVLGGSVSAGAVFGPLTGSTPPIHRQTMIDQLKEYRGPAVLVSQIQAGGVGLNIQSASVVILTEPQWKPTIEDQAIARCHRMGQTRAEAERRIIELERKRLRMKTAL